MEYESTVTLASKVCQGVTFKIVRMSFGRRIHLMRRVRDLSSKIEYHRAGEKLHEHIESNLLRAEIDELYLRWGLKALSGLQLDGIPRYRFADRVRPRRALQGDHGGHQTRVRIKRRRTKKLIVAFHFQFANQAAWRCDECRSQGLDQKRRCARKPIIVAARTVWARHGVAALSCPKSTIRRKPSAFGGVPDAPAVRRFWKPVRSRRQERRRVLRTRTTSCKGEIK